MFGCEGVMFGGWGGSVQAHVSTNSSDPLAKLTLGLETAAELWRLRQMVPFMKYRSRNKSYLSSCNICGIFEYLLRSKWSKMRVRAMIAVLF